MLNAKIWEESKEGEGSTFYFKMKNAIECPTPKLPEKKTEISNDALNKNKTILVVEDEQSNMKLIEIILARRGWQIIKALNCNEALEIFQSNASIDIVLMDLNMPVMNGFDATKEIKKQNSKMPVIALTAYALEGDRQKAIQAGCVDCISEPINRKVLIQTIEKQMVR